MNKARQIQAEYYTKTAQLYDQMHGQDPEHQIALNYISGFIHQMNINSALDVGCGTGRVIKYLLKHYPQLKVCGIEPVEALVQEAINSQEINSDQILCGRGELLPFADKSFDIVCEFAILHHVPDPNLVVKEMMRVAKKAIFISDSNRFGQGQTIARFLKLFLYKVGLWKFADFIRTKGQGYTITEGDGLAYSYSVFDSYNLLAAWADRIILIPTVNVHSKSWFHPLLTSGHVLLCAIKDD